MLVSSVLLQLNHIGEVIVPWTLHLTIMKWYSKIIVMMTSLFLFSISLLVKKLLELILRLIASKMISSFVRTNITVWIIGNISGQLRQEVHVIHVLHLCKVLLQILSFLIRPQKQVKIYSQVLLYVLVQPGIWHSLIELASLSDLVR